MERTRQKVKRRRKTPEQKRQDRIRRIKQNYNKPKVIEFKDMDEVNHIKHFNIPKEVINGDALSQLAMIVYPVLCSRADFIKDDWFQISMKNIAKLSGISEPSVRKAITELLNDKYYIPIYKDETKTDFEKMYILRRKKVTEGQRHFYVYKVGFLRDMLIQKARGGFINLQSLLFDTGIWAMMTKRAKLLYLAMRRDAKFDAYLYAEIENIELHEVNKMTFHERKWDAYSTSTTQLCRSVNIYAGDAYKIIKELDRFGLIESGGFLVYRIPKSSYGEYYLEEMKNRAQFISESESDWL